ncbi:MAG: hypothetical protein ACREGH_00955, partial [Minisyncoccia bacterium]
MLLTIIGGSPEEKRRARKAVWNGALTDIEIEKMSGAELAAMASTEALFGGAEGYRLQNIFSGKRGISTGETEEESEAAPAVFGDEALTPDFFLAVASALANSSHTFILEEEKL